MNMMLMIFFICQFSFGSSVLLEFVTWKRVLFSENDLIGEISSSAINLNKNIYCGTSCLSTDNCLFWCIKPDGRCYLYNLGVSPAYETTGGNLIDCYTEKRNDIVLQASVASIGHGPYDVIETLIDGIEEERYCTSYNSESWILINLKKSALIKDVIIYVIDSDIYGPEYCQYIEVRISSTAPVTPGDFSSWNLFHYLDRKCVGGAIEHLKSSSPKIGQYVSLRKKRSGYFCINHLEIDGEFID